jgi:hypothetical protein
MLGYSKTVNYIYVLSRNRTANVQAKASIQSVLVRLPALSRTQRREIFRFQGRVATIYLLLRYGSRRTYVLMAHSNNALVHCEWIVPAEKIAGKYPFVAKNSYAIISCRTKQDFRGLGIYPSQLSYVANSGVSPTTYWIWADANNTPSLKGIVKAGGEKVGQCSRTRWFWGLFSTLTHTVENTE